MRKLLAALALITGSLFGNGVAASPIEGFAEIPSGATFILGIKVGVDLRYISSTGEISYYSRFTNQSQPLLPFSTVEFMWSARLLQDGSLDGSGAASLTVFDDTGNTAVATGAVRDFGFGLFSCAPADPSFCRYTFPSVSIELLDADAALAPFVGNWWRYIGFFGITVGAPGFLGTDVICGVTHDCTSFSSSDLWFYVPEPSMLALAAISLVAFGFTRRRKQHSLN